MNLQQIYNRTVTKDGKGAVSDAKECVRHDAIASLIPHRADLVCEQRDCRPAGILWVP